MSSEDFDFAPEIVSREAEYELDPSSKEVVGIIAGDAEQLEAEGRYELETLLEGLSETDPIVISTREHLSNIAARAKDLSRWAAASLALSAAQPAIAQEVPSYNETEIVVTASAKPYKLEFNNPQREGYTTPEGYRKYLDGAWETLRKPYIPVPRDFSLDSIAEDVYQKKYEDLSPQERYGVEVRYKSRVPREEKVLQEQNEKLKEFEESIKPSFDIARSLPDEKIDIVSEEYQKALENLDVQRKWLADVVHSPEYKRRLVINEKINDLTKFGDTYENVYGESVSENEGKKPIEPLERRKSRVVEDVLHVSDLQYPIGTENLGEWHPKESGGSPEHVRDNAVIQKLDSLRPESTTALHELEHHVTEAEKGISPGAVWLYSRAFNYDLMSQEYPEQVDYYSNPVELAAFKREFEYKLEQLIDWKYGEQLTQKHVEQIKMLRNTGKLDKDCELFLQMIKPEYLMRVMNTLAENSPRHRVIGESQERKV